MTQRRRPRFDFIPGTDQDVVIVLIIGLAMAYIATGRWAAERWREAAGVAGPAAGGILYGKKKGEKDGWERGYNTLNPELHVDEIIARRSGVGGQIASTVAQGVVAGVAGAAVDHAVGFAVDRFTEQLPQWPGSTEPAPPPVMPPPLQLQQQVDPREAKPPGPMLPKGWRVDSRGRFRDRRGRIASDTRRIETLKQG